MRIRYFLLFFLTLTCKSFAAENRVIAFSDSIPHKPKLRQTVWVNLGQITRNEIQVGFEKYISPNLSLELSLGYKYPEHSGKPFEVALSSLAYLDTYDYAERMHFSEGFLVALAGKGYHTSINHPWFRSYLTPSFFYRNRFFEEQFIESITEKSDDKRFNGKSLQSLDLHIYGVKLIAGHTIDMVIFNDLKKIQLDLYYGVGYRFKKAKTSYYGFNRADYGSPTVQATGPPSIERNENKWASLQGGIRLGFSF